MLSRADRKSKYRAIEDLRRRRIANLLLIRDAYESQGACARHLGLTEPFMSQILSGARNIGEVLARDIERAAGKPEGWLDQRRT